MNKIIKIVAPISIDNKVLNEDLQTQNVVILPCSEVKSKLTPLKVFIAIKEDGTKH